MWNKVKQRFCLLLSATPVIYPKYNNTLSSNDTIESGTGMGRLNTNNESSKVTIFDKKIDPETFRKDTFRPNPYSLFSGRNSMELSNEISLILGKELSSIHLADFKDGECNIRIHDNIRGNNVYLIQSTSIPDGHENLFELLFTISASQRAAAREVIAVIPYFGYCRQDRMRLEKRETIAAADVILMLQSVGVDHVITVDIHHRQMQGFFGSNIKVDNLESLRTVVPPLLQKDLFNPVIVCPSDTGVYRAEKLKELFEKEGLICDIAFITTIKNEVIQFPELDHHKSIYTELDTHKKDKNYYTEMIGNVKNKDVIIIDDMIDTGSRIITAANHCKNNGALRIYAFATHGLFSNNAIDKINNCNALDEVFVTNTIDIMNTNGYSSNNIPNNKISRVSIGPLIAEAIRRNQIHNSLSSITHLNE